MRTHEAADIAAIVNVRIDQYSGLAPEREERLLCPACYQFMRGAVKGDVSRTGLS